MPEPMIGDLSALLARGEGQMFKHDFKLHYVPANVNWVIETPVSSYAPL